MADPGGTASPYPMPRPALQAVAALCLALAGCGGEAEQTADTPSGYPLPRWVSVRGAPASMRAGPGLDYPVLWLFERSGAPLQVVTETEEWRKVCGPDGSIGWIHRSLTSGRRRAVATRAAAVLAAPEAGSEVRARLAPRALVSIEACANGWCEVRADDVSGFAPDSSLFGAAEQPLCDPRAQATRGELPIDTGG